LNVSHLDFSEVQWLAAQELQRERPARAAVECGIQLAFVGAFAAQRTPRQLDDLECGAVRGRVFSAKLEAELEGVRNDGRQFADLEHDARDAPACAVLYDQAHQIVRETQFVHR
jgi:hypothetical protein